MRLAMWQCSNVMRTARSFSLAELWPDELLTDYPGFLSLHVVV